MCVLVAEGQADARAALRGLVGAGGLEVAIEYMRQVVRVDAESLNPPYQCAPPFPPPCKIPCPNTRFVTSERPQGWEE